MTTLFLLLVAGVVVIPLWAVAAIYPHAPTWHREAKHNRSALVKD